MLKKSKGKRRSEQIGIIQSFTIKTAKNTRQKYQVKKISRKFKIIKVCYIQCLICCWGSQTPKNSLVNIIVISVATNKLNMMTTARHCANNILEMALPDGRWSKNKNFNTDKSDWFLLSNSSIAWIKPRLNFNFRLSLLHLIR